LNTHTHTHTHTKPILQVGSSHCRNGRRKASLPSPIAWTYCCTPALCCLPLYRRITAVCVTAHSTALLPHSVPVQQAYLSHMTYHCTNPYSTITLSPRIELLISQSSDSLQATASIPLFPKHSTPRRTPRDDPFKLQYSTTVLVLSYCTVQYDTTTQLDTHRFGDEWASQRQTLQVSADASDSVVACSNTNTALSLELPCLYSNTVT
jgi:hypothetical protein